MGSRMKGAATAIRSLVAIALLVAAIGSTPTPAASATEVLDQEQLAWTGGVRRPTLAQTFVAGLSGDLTRLRLYLFSMDFSPEQAGTMTVEIRATDGGAPTGDADAGTGDVLASQPLAEADVFATFPPVAVGDDTAIDIVFEDPASVVAGTTYAIVLVQNPDTVVFWLQHSENGTDGPYAAGQRWGAASGEPLSPITFSDAAFQTYVTAADVGSDPADLAIAVGDAAAALDADAWRAGGTANAFASRIDGIVSAIENGDLTGARTNAVELRSRVDGCGTVAENNDWIKDCAAQTEVRALLDALIDALTP